MSLDGLETLAGQRQVVEGRDDDGNLRRTVMGGRRHGGCRLHCRRSGSSDGGLCRRAGLRLSIRLRLLTFWTRLRQRPFFFNGGERLQARLSHSIFWFQFQNPLVACPRPGQLTEVQQTGGVRAERLNVRWLKLDCFFQEQGGLTDAIHPNEHQGGGFGGVSICRLKAAHLRQFNQGGGRVAHPQQGHSKFRPQSCV